MGNDGGVEVVLDSNIQNDERVFFRSHSYVARTEEHSGKNI